MFRISTTAVIIWVAGLVVGVPLAVWYLLFQAEREQYALLITFIIGWPFLYWPTVGPVIMAVKARAVYKSLMQATSGDDLRRRLANGEAEEVVIDLIARENRVPRWVARRVYRCILRVAATSGASATDAVEQPLPPSHPGPRDALEPGRKC